MIKMVKLSIMKLLLSHSVALIFKDLLLPIQYDGDSQLPLSDLVPIARLK